MERYRTGDATSGRWLVGRRVFWPLVAVMAGMATGEEHSYGQILSGSLNATTIAETTFNGIDGPESRAYQVGDVDGDGSADLGFADPYGDGRIVLVYSDAFSASSIDLNDVDGGSGSNLIPGVIYDGTGSGGNARDMSIASAGDVNGDDLPDLLIGKKNANPDYYSAIGGAWGGKAYLVYGASTPLSGLVTLENVGTTGPSGAQFFGPTDDDFVGDGLATGDFNGDQISDIIISASAEEHPYDSSGMEGDYGRIYVIYGDDTSAPSGIYNINSVGKDLSSPEFALNPAFESFFPYSSYPFFYHRPIEGAVFNGEIRGTNPFKDIAVGDVNGDGKDDILGIGNDNGSGIDGRTYLIYGAEGGFEGENYLEAVGETEEIDAYRPDPSGPIPLALEPIPGAVFSTGVTGRLPGATVNEPLAQVLPGTTFLGDVNGDGIGDFTQGPYLVFGDDGTEFEDASEVIAYTEGGASRDDRIIRTGKIGADVTNAVQGVQFAGELAAAGDVNGDGLGDFILGHTLVYGTIRTDWLALVDGDNGEYTISSTDLASLGNGLDGVIFTGLTSSARIDPAGDINGDGIDDLIASDPTAGTDGLYYSILGASDPGDLNGDGTVDNDDLNIVVGNYLEYVTPGVWAYGDIVESTTYPGRVDSDDLNYVLLHFDSTPVTAVPEPAGLSCVLGAAILAFRKRRSRSS